MVGSEVVPRPVQQFIIGELIVRGHHVGDQDRAVDRVGAAGDSHIGDARVQA